MDYKKDIKDTVLMSRGTQSGIETFSVTLSKKCERLATAVYLVTNFLSDTEPLKFRLRTLSVDFVRDASFVKNGSHTTEASVLESLCANIHETLALLELAFIAGLVSEMNFTILKREYVSLRDTVEIKKASRESRTDSILGDNFFGISQPRTDLGYSRSQSLVAPTTTDQRVFTKGQFIGQKDIAMSDRNTKGQQSQRPEPRAVLGDSQGQSLVNTTSAPAPHPRATTDVAKESRRARILKLVKDNREVTIKDIATHFADLSEKTIQRELVALVESGVLKKFGERRWSRYALA